MSNMLSEYIQNKVTEVCKNTMKEADRILLEYMQKKGLTLDDLQGNVVMQNVPCTDLEINTTQLNYWYKGELILSVKQKFDITQPLIARSEMIIAKGEW